MRLKSYYSETVEAAMELARQDLGDDALLVNVRPAAPEQLHLGDYEVVFGVTGEASGLPVAKDTPMPREAPNAKSAGVSSRSSLAKRWMPPDHESEPTGHRNGPEITPAPDLTIAKPSHPERDPDQHDSPSPLTNREPLGALSEPIADLRRVVAALERIPSGEGPEGTFRPFAEPPTPEFDPTLGVSGAARKIVALIGPSGVGKTTTVLKLAVSQGLALNRTVQLITTDVHRVGAASRLRAMTAVLGLACRTAESAEALEQLLEDTRGVDLLLIDTPPDLSAIPGLAGSLAEHPEIDTHLVLAASMSDSAITSAEAVFHASNPAKVVLTKLDELGQKGPWTNEALRAGSSFGLPISFVGCSSEIPDGLEPASEAQVSDAGALKPTEMRATA